MHWCSSIGTSFTGMAFTEYTLNVILIERIKTQYFKNIKFVDVAQIKILDKEMVKTTGLASGRPFYPSVGIPTTMLNSVCSKF